MKKLLAILLSISMVLSFTGCQTKESEHIHEDFVCVGIRIHEDGYYSLMGSVELSYYEGELSEIYIDEPTLLAFAISSRYNGGVYILDLTEGEAFIDELSVISEKIDNPELVERVNALIEKLQRIGPITGVST